MNTLFITWNPDAEIFTIGNFGLRWYGFLFAMGFFLAYTVLYFVFKREKVALSKLDWLTFYIFIAVLVGARLGHVFFYEWGYYRENLSEIPMVWKGGLASHGAAIAIIIALIIYVKQFKVNVWWLFDRMALAIPVTAAFVRLGNLMNSEIYGLPTSMPWGFIFRADPAAGLLPRHPTQLYEAISYLLIALVLIILYRKNLGINKPGLFVGIFLSALFTARFLIEFFKEVQVDFEHGMRFDMGQWLSVPFILLGVGFIIFALKSKPKVADKKL
ncbi:MAG TPA: prolipoprotein diacylglyceryl transferase [Bacteroidales bacterium]|nr:prolipoprotein diacylglyceryl transferase [Bacteroidales bacterium]HPB25132.1 prolipoprotein diacylglyceryl transferase [Bacteroidales bacterium]HPI30019.1 prolipoprotein diacylglyceryl transferase [Bacteroidales bacterium]HQN15941.1 prolipoprotein diacylglyceryl transferase [Bacteroidales bacterium]HQP15555.1 prolipoprotein diacylglyceryl transferase [Bacteroidales bacterium]